MSLSNQIKYVCLVVTLIINQPFLSSAEYEYDPNCPCLDESLHNATRKIAGNESCLDTRFVLDQNTNIQESFCYSEKYGLGCAAHDENLGPVCNGNEDTPDYCSSSWCFVDSDQCQSSANNSFAKSPLYPHLFYSYSTCGNVDTFTDFSIAAALQGKTLKVGIPALSYPDHYRLDENNEPIFWSTDINAGVGELKGMYMEYVQKLAQDGNFQIEFTQVSLGSIAEAIDPYSACVLDVSRGILDMCAGTFWETTERTSVASFTTALTSEVYNLALLKPKAKDDVITHMRMIFKPFTPKLWYMIIAVTFVVGIAYTLLGPDRKTSRPVRFYDLIDDIYCAWLELLQGTDDSKKKTFAQRSVVLAWSFFILIIIAAYTANLAAFLATESFDFRIEDIDSCLRHDCLVCHTASSVLSASLERFYPTLRTHSNYTDVSILVDDLANENCDVLLVSNFQWNLNSAWWKDCEVIRTNDIVIFFKVGFPVTLSIAQAMSFFISRSLDEGAFDRSFNAFAPPKWCLPSAELTQKQENIPQITVAAMASPLIFIGLGIVFGFIIKYGKKCKGIKAGINNENNSARNNNLPSSDQENFASPFAAYIR